MKQILSIVIALFTVTILQAQPPQVPADAGAIFGKATTAENAVSMEQYVKLLESRGDGKPLEGKIIGIVKEVCQKEGCWIKVESPMVI